MRFTLILLLAFAACSSNEVGEPQFELLSPSDGGFAVEARPELEWSERTDASAYRVWCYADEGETQVIEHEPSTPERSYKFENPLADEQVVYVRVEALDEAGNVIDATRRNRFRVRIQPDWVPQFTIDVHDPGRSQGGYCLFNVAHTGEPVVGGLMLVNRAGEAAWCWRDPYDGIIGDVRLLQSGTLLATRQVGDEEEPMSAIELTWEGDIVWFPPPGSRAHHEIAIGPGGYRMYVNTIIQEVEGTRYKGDGIDLVDPADNSIVWSWSIWDHYDPINNPTEESQMPPPRPGRPNNWTHCNACVWDEARGVIWVSVRNFDQLIAVDYPSGDIVLTIGEGGLGGVELMSHQHSPELQPDGGILLFDNGNTRDPPYSRVVEFTFDAIAGTVDEHWVWRETPDFFDSAAGDADRLPNGNTLVTSGTRCRLLEVTPGGDVVWSMTMQDHDGWIIHRAEWLAAEEIPDWIRPFD